MLVLFSNTYSPNCTHRQQRSTTRTSFLCSFFFRPCWSGHPPQEPSTAARGDLSPRARELRELRDRLRALEAVLAQSESEDRASQQPEDEVEDTTRPLSWPSHSSSSREPTPRPARHIRLARRHFASRFPPRNRHRSCSEPLLSRLRTPMDAYAGRSVLYGPANPDASSSPSSLSDATSSASTFFLQKVLWRTSGRLRHPEQSPGT
mmetsp:Transcript_17766/g.57531  ORF Transcript_17766/g.57531 Transcript_17766/m.57531 type:complete len:206 (+) Transcript_17766:1516-2133(+)